MEKISKLATVVAKAAKMDKKAEYYDAIATFINPDGNYFEKRKFMGEYTEDEIIKEVIREFPKVKKEDIDIEFGVQSSKKSNLNKKAEEIEPGSIYEKAKAILPEEDIDHHETDLYLRVSPKSTELVNSMKYRNSGMITTFKDNIDGDMWYDLPFCYPYVDSREYKNVPSKEEDEIILRQKKSSKRVKLTKKANYTLTDLVKEDIENIEMCLENIQTTYANALLTKLSMELQERLDNSIVESDLRDLFEVK